MSSVGSKPKSKALEKLNPGESGSKSVFYNITIKSMHGHFLLNLDQEHISYDSQVYTPLIGEKAVSKQELQEVLAELEKTNKNEIRLKTNELDGFHIRELPIDKLDQVIENFEKIVADLKELKVKYEEAK